MSTWGTLTDYNTGAAMRPATRDEWEQSAREVANGNETGAFEADGGNGRAVYVDGGPDMTADGCE